LLAAQNIALSRRAKAGAHAFHLNPIKHNSNQRLLVSTPLEESMPADRIKQLVIAILCISLATAATVIVNLLM
jgi:hypothetical protein